MEWKPEECSYRLHMKSLSLWVGSRTKSLMVHLKLDRGHDPRNHVAVIDDWHPPEGAIIHEGAYARLGTLVDLSLYTPLNLGAHSHTCKVVMEVFRKVLCRGVWLSIIRSPCDDSKIWILLTLTAFTDLNLIQFWNVLTWNLTFQLILMVLLSTFLVQSVVYLTTNSLYVILAFLLLLFWRKSKSVTVLLSLSVQVCFLFHFTVHLTPFWLAWFFLPQLYGFPI